uniref:Uncharacterized protein n=1 Tax=Opuntia streptacantha TaxID=393608 RepID=A0A7C9E2S0_OPUST
MLRWLHCSRQLHLQNYFMQQEPTPIPMIILCMVPSLNLPSHLPILGKVNNLCHSYVLHRRRYLFHQYHYLVGKTVNLYLLRKPKWMICRTYWLLLRLQLNLPSLLQLLLEMLPVLLRLEFPHLPRATVASPLVVMSRTHFMLILIISLKQQKNSTWIEMVWAMFLRTPKHLFDWTSPLIMQQNLGPS